MLFNEFALCHYLLENGFLNNGQIVDEHIRFTRHFSRNRNFKVLLHDGKGFLVKQPKLSFYQKKSVLKREADVYWLTNNDEDFSGIKNFIPRFHHYDAEVQVLITDLVEPSINLHDYHTTTYEYPENIATKQAEILAAMHNITIDKIANKKSFSLFPKKPNWLFNIDGDDEWWFGKKSPADLQLLDLIKSNVDFVKCVQTAKEKWKTSCLLHNDIRWTNFLMKDSDAAQIKLIDWELADFGDPAWDIAGILQSYFTYWILNQDADPFRLLKMKPAIAAFNKAYNGLVKLSKEEMNMMLKKSIEFTGVRLVQSCIENVSYQKELDRKTIQLLQFSFNILKNPEQAFFDFIEPKRIHQ